MNRYRAPLLFSLLTAALLMFAPLAQVAAHHTEPGQRWAFHWGDDSRETIVLSDSGAGEAFTLRKDANLETPDWYTFAGQVNFGSGCPDSSAHINVPKSVYDRPNSNAVEIVNGGLQGAGNCDANRAFRNVVQDNRPIIAATNQSPEEVLEDMASSQPGGANNSGDSCRDNVWEFGWLLCPLIFAMEGGLSAMDSMVTRLLEVPLKYFEPITITESDGSVRVGTPLKDVWAVMRNLALLMLVPIALVMVISTAIGSELISAYTVKKALPRLVIAAMFISLSWQIIVFFVEFSNVLGRGAAGLVTAPVGGFSETGLSELLGRGDGLFLMILTGGGVAIGAAALGGVTAVAWILLLVAASFVLVLLTGLLLLLVREMLIMTLAILAPLAILSWIFPGRDRLWKLWLGSFSKLLLLFPLITLLLGSGRMIAAIVDNVYTNPLIKLMLILIAYVGPFLFIPATFKFAGGLFANLAGVVNDKERGLFDRLRKKRQGEVGRRWQEHGRRNLTSARGTAYRNLNRAASNYDTGGRGRRWASRVAARAIGGRNIEAEISAITAEAHKEVNDMIATGRDAPARGLAAIGSMQEARSRGWDGRSTLTDASGFEIARNEGGRRQYRTIGGAWMDEADVLEGQRIYGDDRFAQQAIVGYEMRKATQEGHVEGFANRFNNLSRSLNMRDDEASDAWVGASFQNAAQHLEFKNTDWKTGELKGGEGAASRIRGATLIQEMFDNKGSYQLSQGNAHTIRMATEAYRNAQEVHRTAGSDEERAAAQRVMDQSRDIARTFMLRGSTRGFEGEGDDAVPVASSGSAAVERAVQEFARATGVSEERPGPTGAGGT